MKKKNSLDAIDSPLPRHCFVINMKPAIVIFSLLLFFSNDSFAEKYGVYDLKKILITAEPGSGNKHALDLMYIDAMIKDLNNHANGYPPQFDNDNDMQRAKNDARRLSGALDMLVDDPNAPIELLRRSSLLNRLAYNLDIPGSAQKVDRDFKNLLSQRPGDPVLNLSYGVFLSGANKSSQALPYLKESAEAGFKEAYLHLGMAYLYLRDTEQALNNLEIYRSHYPNNAKIGEIIDAIKSGNIKYNRLQKS
ncbi:hypothetical protein [Marinomonas fungiae]|uniref:tetratricopeptide repeat protein n=1 Tax=Marinomonas fungiae TaxID=1137284 RepID=UPI003A950B24